MVEIVKEIMSDNITDPEFAMRGKLDRATLFELADNIKQNGLINPITVRPLASGYEVVAGHRRFAALKINGTIKIPCVVRELTDKEVFAVMAAENLEREDVDAVDEANFISRYIDMTKLSVQEVAKQLRRSLSYVETRLAVGQMPDYMKQYIKTGELKLGSALYLMQITDDPIRKVWTDMAVRDGISVRQAEYWLHGWKMQQLPGAEQTATPPGDFEPSASAPVQFRCSIDGEMYDARLCRTLIVSENNLGIFNAFVSEFRKSPADTPLPPNETSATARR